MYTKYDSWTTSKCPSAYKDKLHQLIRKFGVSQAQVIKLTGLKTTNIFHSHSKNILWKPDLLKVLDLFHISFDDFTQKPIEQLTGGYINSDLLRKNYTKRKKYTPKETKVIEPELCERTLELPKDVKKPFSIESDGVELTIKITL